MPGDVQLGHDRPAEGRDAHAHQHGPAHPQRPRGLGLRRPATRTWSRCRCSTSAARRTCCSGSTTACPSVMTRDPDGASLAGAILQGANRTFLVPAVLAQVLQSGPEAIALFGKLKTYCYGAAPMPLPLLRAAMEAWPDTDFIQVYGLTEVRRRDHPPDARGPPRRRAPRAAGQRRPAASPRRRCAWSTRPPSRTCRPGEPGELWFRTPQLMKGYLGKPEETAEVITEDGWFRTGDIGRVDEDGLRLRRGPAQGHDHHRRREHLLARGRAGAGRAPGRRWRSP